MPKRDLHLPCTLMITLLWQICVRWSSVRGLMKHQSVLRMMPIQKRIVWITRDKGRNNFATALSTNTTQDRDSVGEASGWYIPTSEADDAEFYQNHDPDSHHVHEIQSHLFPDDDADLFPVYEVNELLVGDPMLMVPQTPPESAAPTSPASPSTPPYPPPPRQSGCVRWPCLRVELPGW